MVIMRRFGFLFILLSSLLFTTSAYAAPVPTVTVSAPTETPLGSTFNVGVTFDNTGDIGYGPVVDIVLDTTGVDGDPIAGEPNDGLIFGGTVNYAGQAIPAEVQTFPDSPLGTSPCGATESQLEHPYYLGASGTPQPVCGTPGDTLISVELPFGSFTPGQPPIEIDFDVTVSDLADLGAPLDIWSRAGFQYGADELDNFCCDPAELSPDTPIVSGWNNTTVTPTLLDISKSSDLPEGETATGPNFPRTWTVEVDVAPGQTVTDLDVFDYLPNNVIVTAITSTAGGGSVTSIGGSAPSLPAGPLVADDVQNEVVVNFPSVTGTAGAGEAAFTVDFYFPLDDADNINVLDPASGDDGTAENRASAIGDWTPVDSRDIGGTDNASANGTCPGCPPLTTETPKSIAIQKNRVTVVDENAPGDTPDDVLEYTLDIQISDYFAFDGIVVTDLMEDGQRFDTSFTPTLSVTEAGSTSSAAFDAANFSEVVDTGNTGNTTLTFNISDELITRALDGVVHGGCVPDGGTGGPDPNCDVASGGFNGGPTTLTVVYRAIIQDEYSDTFPSGDRSVDQGDTFGNGVTVTGNVLPTDDTSATPTDTEEDESGTTVEIVSGNLTKSVYAINGNTSFSTPVQVGAGDVVTYRLEYTLPTTDIEQLTLTDYLPLPVFDVTDPAQDGSVSGFTFAGGPVSYTPGTVQLGPNDTFTDNTGVTPGINQDPTLNSVTASYGDYDLGSQGTSTVELLIHTTTADDPFAPRLFLTNQAEVSFGTTQENTDSADAIVQIEYTAPDMRISKGAVSAPGASPVFSPATVGPATLAPAGDAGPVPFTGTIGSDTIGATPIDSDVGNVDAGDLVRFVITVENSGPAVNGVFDVQISDILPAGYAVPGGGINLQAALGDGTVLSTTPVGAATTDSTGLFDDGVEVFDPGAPTGPVCQGEHPSDGTNIIVVAYDLILTNTIEAGDTLTNTVSLDNFASSDGGPNFVDANDTDPDYTDDADTTIATPTISKTASVPELAVGDTFQYTVEMDIPEGTMTDMTMTDTFDAGLALSSIDSVTVSSGDLSTSVGTFADVASGVSVPAGGESFTLDFGTVQNTNTDNAVTETITVTYTAVVTNVTGNQRGTTLGNEATLTWSLGDVTDSANDVTVIEPTLDVVKTFDTGGGDAGDGLTITLDVSHATSSNATAYDVVVTDAIPAGMTFASGFTTESGVAPTSATESGNVVTLTWDELTTAQSSSVSFTVTLDPGVQPEEVIENTGEVTYTSTDDTQGTTDTYNTDGRERTGVDGPGGALDDYADEDSDTFTVDEVEIVKQLEHPDYTPVADSFGGNYTDSTSDPDTAGTDVAIGEEFSYIVTVTLPEGTTENLRFLDDVSPFMSISNNTVIELLQVQVIGVGGQLSGPSLPAVNDTFPLLDANSDGDDTRLDTPNFGDIANAPDGAIDDGDRLVFRVDARMDDEDASTGPADGLPGVNNVDGEDARNRARVQFDDANGNMQTETDSFDVDIVEPDLAIAKNAISTGGNGTVTGGNLTDANAGDTVTYQTTVTNNGNAPAYDLTLTDTPPAEFINCALDSVTLEGATPTFTGDLFSTNLVLDSGDPLQPGDSLDVEYTCELDYTVYPQQDYVNTAEIVSYNSQPGAPEDNREYTGPTDDATVTVEGYDLEKTITATSEDHTDSGEGLLPSDGSGEDVPVAIGEIVRYRLATTLPEGQNDAVTILDQLSDGIVPVFDETMEITFTYDNALTFTEGAFAGVPSGTALDLHDGADFTTAGASVVNYTGPGNDPGDNLLTFELGDITNNDNDGDAEQVIIDFNVIVTNENVTNIGDILANDYEVTSDDSTGTAQSRGTSNEVSVVVQEPEFMVDKVASPTTGDAGDTVNYTITVTNGNAANNTTAFDVVITDALQPPLDLISVDNITTAGGVSAPADSSDVGTDTITLDVATFPAGGSVTIELTVQLRTTVTPGQTITNTSTAIYTSLPGDFGTDSNPTGSSLSGQDGTTTGGVTYTTDTGEPYGERNDDGGVNDYEATDDATVNVIAPDFNKTVFDTSEADTTGSDVAVGEIITYRMTVRIPEGTTPTAQVTDTLPNLTDGDPGQLEYVSATVVSIGGNTTPGATTGGNLTNVGIAVGDSVPAAGINGDSHNEEIVFDLTASGDISNAPDGVADASDDIVIEIVAQVTDIVENAATDTLTNTAALDFGGTPAEGTADVTVTEPDLTLTKSNTTITPEIDAGDTVTYTLEVTNNGNAPAQDVNITDNLPAELILSNGSVNATTTGSGIVTDNSSGNDVIVDLDTLEIGETLTVMYDVTVDGTATIGQLIDNTADLTYDSLEADDSEAREYTDTTTDQVTVDDTIAPEKTIAGTSEAGTSGADVTIGEVITYQLATRLIEGTNTDVTLTDTFVNGIEYVPGSAVVYGITDTTIDANLNGGAVTTLPNSGSPYTLDTATEAVYDGGTRTLTVNLGDLVNNDTDNDGDEFVVVRFEVQVVDEPINTAGRVWDNNYTVTMDGGNVSETSNDMTATVTEPDLTLTKSNSTIAPVDNGDTVTYTLQVTNNGDAPAQDVNITDNLPTELVLTLASVNASTTGSGIVTDNSSGNDVIVDLDTLEIGETLTVMYDVTVDGTATIGQLIDNTADLTYDSLEADDSEAREYTDTTTDQVTVDDTIAPEKTIAGTSEAGTSGADVTIGEVITYQLATRLIEGTNTDVTLTDTFVNGIEYVPGSAVAYGIADTTIDTSVGGLGTLPDSSAPYTLDTATEAVYDGGTRTLTINLGDLVNNDTDNGNDEFVVVEFEVQVINDAVNNTGQLWNNNYTVTMDGGSISDTSDDVTVTVIEPVGTIDKQINTTLSNPSGTTTFTVGDTVVYDIVVAAMRLARRHMT